MSSTKLPNFTSRLAPVELEGLTQLKCQLHEGLGGDALAVALAPRPHKVGDAAVAAGVALGLDLRVHCTRRTPLVSRAMRIDLERQPGQFVVRGKLARRFAAPVLWRLQ